MDRVVDDFLRIAERHPETNIMEVGTVVDEKTQQVVEVVKALAIPTAAELVEKMNRLKANLIAGTCSEDDVVLVAGSCAIWQQCEGPHASSAERTAVAKGMEEIERVLGSQ